MIGSLNYSADFEIVLCFWLNVQMNVQLGDD